MYPSKSRFDASKRMHPRSKPGFCGKSFFVTPHQKACKAFTVVELLVVIGIVSLLLSILIPALSASRSQGRRAKCLAQLKGLAEVGSAYSVDDPRSQLLPVHPIADENVDHDEGFFDYGGATGTAEVFGGTRYGPNGPRTAATRPMNRYLAPQAGADGDYSAYQCPSDTGWPAINNRDADWIQWDDAMMTQPTFTAVGTSYLGNAGRVPTYLTAGGWASFTPFLRPANRIPSAHTTVLFSESLFWLGVFNIKGVFYAGEEQLVDGWHGRAPKHNVAMADGHAETVSLVSTYGMGGQPGIPPEEVGATRALWLEQPGWRVHCRPDDLIVDLPRPQTPLAHASN